ncbi:MAG: hypothetical protein WBM51_04010, partial [Pseudolabrys sp.]
ILQAAGADFGRTVDVERALMARARLLLDISKLLSTGSAQQRAATTQTPRRPTGAGGEKSEPLRLGVRDHHACSV